MTPTPDTTNEVKKGEKTSRKGQRQSKERPDALKDEEITPLLMKINLIESRLDSLETMKNDLSTFIFQSVSIIVGLFAIIVTVIIGYSSRIDLDIYGITIVNGLLGFISVLIILWYRDWKNIHRTQIWESVVMRRRGKTIRVIEKAVTLGQINGNKLTAKDLLSIGIKSATASNFLSKHRRGNPSGTTEYFKRNPDGSYRLL